MRLVCGFKERTAGTELMQVLFSLLAFLHCPAAGVVRLVQSAALDHVAWTCLYKVRLIPFNRQLFSRMLTLSHIFISSSNQPSITPCHSQLLPPTTEPTSEFINVTA